MAYIKKIAKKKVEKNLDVKLQSNKIAIGADTAQYHTAFAVIRTTDKYVILETLEKITVPKLPKHACMRQTLDSVDLFTEQLDDFKKRLTKLYKFDYARIEDCYFGFSAKTMKVLAWFGILTYDRLKRISTDSNLLMPNSARAKIKFKKSKKKLTRTQLKKEIINYINETLETDIEDNDETDACVLALAGLVI